MTRGSRLWGAVSAALLWAVSASSWAEQPRLFTEACSLATGAYSQWYSPAQQNESDKVPNPCRTCLDPANRDDAACLVDSFLRSSACAAGRCADRQGEFRLFPAAADRFVLQRDLRFEQPQSFPRARGENCRFILWALDPLLGTEDPTLEAGPDYWRIAYEASQARVSPPFPPGSVGFVLQSALTRGQHQFHIHLGTLTEPYREAIGRLARDPARIQEVRINGHDMKVRFVADKPGAGPFTGENPSMVARDMLPRGAADLPLYGILAARAPEGGGSFVFVAPGLAREELNFRQPSPCTLR